MAQGSSFPTLGRIGELNVTPGLQRLPLTEDALCSSRRRARLARNSAASTLRSHYLTSDPSKHISDDHLVHGPGTRNTDGSLSMLVVFCSVAGTSVNARRATSTFCRHF